MTRSVPPSFSLEAKNYKLSLFFQNKNRVKLILRLNSRTLYTSELPNVPQILKDRLPEIFGAQCFNDQNLPFHREVEQTELGHLLEHIILEYLCNLKLERGHKNPCFWGITRWDWTRNPKGTFHITIKIARRDSVILPEALERSISLFNLLLNPTTQRAEEFCAIDGASTPLQTASRPY